MRASVASVRRQLGQRSIEAQELIQPCFDAVARCVSDRLTKLDLFQRSTPGPRRPELLKQLEGKAASRAFVAVDRRREKHEVGTQKRPHHRKGNRRCLVDDHELRLTQYGMILRLDILDRLPVSTEHIDAHDRVFPLARATLQVPVGHLLVPERIQTLEHKLKERTDIVRARRRHKHVAVAVRDGRGKTQTERSRLATSTAGRESDSRRKRRARQYVQDRQNSRRLVHRPSMPNDVAHDARL